MRHVHHSTHKLDDLAGRIAAHFRDSFVCGEEVLGTKDGAPTPCKVVAVHEAPPVEGTLHTLIHVCMKRPLRQRTQCTSQHYLIVVAGVESSVFDTQYDIQWIADGRLTGEPVKMPRTDLFRKKPVVAKPMLKAWIAEVAACEIIQVRLIRPSTVTARCKFKHENLFPGPNTSPVPQITWNTAHMRWLTVYRVEV